jgi:hypothetical protein
MIVAAPVPRESYLPPARSLGLTLTLPPRPEILRSSKRFVYELCHP